MKTRSLLQQSAIKLEQEGCDSPHLDAELLLMKAWQISRMDIIVRAHDEVPQSVIADYTTLLERRIRREPLAYIFGEKEFWSRSFQVNPDVLIPRPETEHLIEAVLEKFPDQNGEYYFCDIGAGSGCIAVTLACEYPRSHIVATDVSSAAIKTAGRNAEIHHVSERLIFRSGDMLEALKKKDGPFDAIISNPPYVASHEMQQLDAELAYEPQTALTAAADGLQYLHTILKNGPEYLCPQGYIILETGLCGLPDTPANLQLEDHIHDLANHLRGAVYRLV
jgi:release factor glutamine methyltransferase